MRGADATCVACRRQSPEREVDYFSDIDCKEPLINTKAGSAKLTATYSRCLASRPGSVYRLG